MRRGRRALRDLRDGCVVAAGHCAIAADEVQSGKVVSVRCACAGSGTPRCEPAVTLADPGRLTAALAGELNQAPSPFEGTVAFSFLPCRRGWLARQLAAHQQELIARPDTSPLLAGRLLRSLARSPEPSARIDVAGREICPPEVLAALAVDWWWEVRAAVAANRTCAPDLARQLAADRCTWVRRAVAENEQIAPAALRLLATDSDFGVRDAVAEHPCCPADVLEGLCHDPVWEIRRSVAKRTDAPATALAVLAGDCEHWVRFFVACNPATPDPIRQQLEQDPRPSVRAVAAKRRARDRHAIMYLALDTRRPQQGVRPPDFR